jgi:hypothetical protein
MLQAADQQNGEEGLHGDELLWWTNCDEQSTTVVCFMSTVMTYGEFGSTVIFVVMNKALLWFVLWWTMICYFDEFEANWSDLCSICYVISMYVIYELVFCDVATSLISAEK